MNGYVEGGYVVSVGSLLVYGVSVVARERAARLRARPTVPSAPSPFDALLDARSPEAEWADGDGRG